MIRLGLTWAGAQPSGPHADLDSDVLKRLDAILDLCHEHNLNVMIDLHHSPVGLLSICGVVLMSGVVIKTASDSAFRADSKSHFTKPVSLKVK